MKRARPETQIQQEIDQYFFERRAKEIRRLIIAVFAMVVGVPIAGFSDPIASFLEVNPSVVSGLGLMFNLCGFGLLTIWIMDGKNYVFPPRQTPGKE